MKKVTLIQSLEEFAKKGKHHTCKNLWRTQITRLRRQGFYVLEKFPTGLKGQYHCFICWKESKTGAALRLWETVCNLK